MQFSDLARDHHVTIGTQCGGDVFQGFNDPVRGFIEDLCPRRFADALEQLSALSALGGKESAEAERVGWKPAGDEC